MDTILVRRYVPEIKRLVFDLTNRKNVMIPVPPVAGHCKNDVNSTLQKQGIRYDDKTGFLFCPALADSQYEMLS